MVCLGGGSLDIVALLELAFLMLCVALGVWWFTHTSTFRSRRRYGANQPGHQDPNHNPGNYYYPDHGGGGGDGGGGGT